MRRALVLVGINALDASTVELAVPVPIPMRLAAPDEFLRMLRRGQVWAALIDDNVFTAEFRNAVSGVSAAMLCHSGRPLREARAELADLGIGFLHRGQGARSTWAGIRRAVLRRVREAAVQRIDGNHQARSLIWQAIRTVLLAREPIHSVAAVARHLGCDSSSLYKAWKTLLRRTDGLTLGEFVDAVLLLRAVEHSSPLKGLRRALRDFKVRPDRVHRAALLLGSTFDEFKDRRLLELIDAFEERALERLWTALEFDPDGGVPPPRRARSRAFHVSRQVSQV